MLLEWFDSYTPHHIDKPFDFAVAPREVQFDQLFHDIGHFILRHRRPQHFAQRSVIPLRSAYGYLVELRALLVHAQYADMADMVVAARVHATRYIEVEFTDVVLIIEIVEAALYRLRHRYGFRVGQRAEIATGTADNVGNHADIGRGES